MGYLLVPREGRVRLATEPPLGASDRGAREGGSALDAVRRHPTRVPVAVEGGLRSPGGNEHPSFDGMSDGNAFDRGGGPGTRYSWVVGR
jgi:hypothetical protein